MKELRDSIMEKADIIGVEISGLDNVPYIVQGRPLFDFENVPYTLQKNLGINGNDLYLASGHKNIAVFPNGRIEGLCTVSDQYQLLNHLDAINQSIDFIPKGFELEKIKIKVSPDGGRIFVDFDSKINEEIVPGDKIKFRATLQNSADTTRNLRFISGAWRQVCTNGMVIPDSRFDSISLKKMHKTGLDFERECANYFSTLKENFAALSGWKKYTERRMDMALLETVFSDLSIGPKSKNDILSLPIIGRDNTLDKLIEGGDASVWDAYNAFTQSITHSNLMESVKVERGGKVSQVFEALFK